jgi:hypothetical protein
VQRATAQSKKGIFRESHRKQLNNLSSEISIACKDLTEKRLSSELHDEDFF